MIPNSIPKWMKNQCKMYAPKSDKTKKVIKHGAEKGAPNHEQSMNNEVTKQCETLEKIKSTSGKKPG